MKKITSEAVQAFEQGVRFKKGNTEVVNFPETLYLHNNAIARKALFNGYVGLEITTAGWNTPTTRERLNGFNGVHVQTKRGKLFLNGKEWGGEWIEVK